MTRDELIAAGKALAQNGPADGSGMALLLTDPDDYLRALALAVPIFSQDRPRLTVTDYTVIADGFRFTLSDLVEGWVDGGSYVYGVYYPWATAHQGLEVLDGNVWRIVQGPDGEALEFLADRPVASTQIRLVIGGQHIVDGSTNTIRAGDEQAFVLLLGSLILQMAAIKATQNTGNSNLPGDVVDRRSQAQEFRNRSRELRELYSGLVGVGGAAADLRGASAVKDLDVMASFAGDFLYHPSRTH